MKDSLGRVRLVSKKEEGEALVGAKGGREAGRVEGLGHHLGCLAHVLQRPCGHA